MNIEIKNTTVYGRDLIIKYNKFYSNSFMKKNFIVLGVIGLIFMVFMLFQENYAYAGLIAGLIVAYYLLTILMQKLTVKRMMSKSPLIDNPITQIYYFVNDRFTVSTDGNNYEVNYDQIDSVKIGKDLFLLKSNSNKSFIVDFNGFESEDDKKTLEKFFIVRFNIKNR